ncbi:hypothetical protein D3C80_1578120 [compost metagenome]
MAGKRFDLLPLAPGYIYIQAVACQGQSDCGELADFCQLSGQAGQLWKRRGGVQLFGVIVCCFRLVQRTLPQPAGQGRVLSLPGQVQLGEGAWPPKRLVLAQEGVQGLEAAEQLVIFERAGSGHGQIRKRGCDQPRYTGSTALAGVYAQPAFQLLERLHQHEGDHQVHHTSGEEDLYRHVGARNDGPGHADDV